MKWNKISSDGLPPLKKVRNQTAELIGEASDFCLVFGEDNLTVDYYMIWDLDFKLRNGNADLKNGWTHAKFEVTHWTKITKPR
jgi:hypothetical protein